MNDSRAFGEVMDQPLEQVNAEVASKQGLSVSFPRSWMSDQRAAITDLWDISDPFWKSFWRL
jgi:hypothetical protein